MVAEEIRVFRKIHRQRVDLQAMSQALLVGKVARPQVGQVVAQADGDPVTVLCLVHDTVFHGCSDSSSTSW